MSDVEQLSLLPTPSTKAQPVTFEVIIAQPNYTAARRLSVQVSGLTDQQVYMELDIDKGQWSRIMSGKAHFPAEKELQFCRVVGNHCHITWLAYQLGQRLIPCQDAKDKEIEKLKKDNERLRIERETIEKYLVARR